jgi:hypothetical protein
MKFVEVRWMDIAGYPGWHNEDDKPETYEPMRCTSVGYLLYESKDRVVLCGSLGPEKFCDITVIPAGCVDAVRDLEPPRIDE